MGKITVVNKYKHEPTEHDFYVGRGSPLGNPYSHRKNSKADYITETRKEAISKYQEWLYGRLEKVDDIEMLHLLSDIISHYENTGTVNLVCFCKPKSCHGDVIRDTILRLLENDGKENKN